MSPSTDTWQRKVEQEILRHGILLEADAQLPSVVALVAGEPIRGSWWGHPRGHDIFHACQHLREHDEIVTAKLVSKKVTYVHRNLWAMLLAVATCGEAWQTDGLRPTARELLEEVDGRGTVRADVLVAEGFDPKQVGRDLRELEARLLVRTDSIHTEVGKHAKIAESWARWAERVRAESGFASRARVSVARDTFDVLVESLNQRYSGDGSLPW